MTVTVVFFSLVCCEHAQAYYEDRAIRVEVSHISGFEAYEKYDVYFREIKKGQRYELPSGDANPCYKVAFTITKIRKGTVTAAFSQPMDRIRENASWEPEITEFEIGTNGSERFITPTDGGGDTFRFTLVSKSDIP